MVMVVQAGAAVLRRAQARLARGLMGDLENFYGGGDRVVSSGEVLFQTQRAPRRDQALSASRVATPPLHPIHTTA